MKQLSKLGLAIQVTEMDLRIESPATEKDLA